MTGLAAAHAASGLNSDTVLAIVGPILGVMIAIAGWARRTARKVLSEEVKAVVDGQIRPLLEEVRGKQITHDTEIAWLKGWTAGFNSAQPSSATVPITSSRETSK